MSLHAQERERLAGLCRRDSEDATRRITDLLDGKETFAEPDPDPIYGGAPRIHRPDGMYVEWEKHPKHWSQPGGGGPRDPGIPHPYAGKAKRWPVRAMIAELTGHTDLTDEEAADVLTDAGWHVIR